MMLDIRSVAFINNFKYIPNIVLLFLLMTLNKKMMSRKENLQMRAIKE